MLFTWQFNAAANNTIYISKAGSLNDQRMAYKLEILDAALLKTQKEYGAFKVIQIDLSAVPQRARFEVQSATNINLMMAVTTKELEDNLLTIRIPIRRGILNYRLLATSQANLSDFSNINGLDDLKALGVGLRSSWATTTLFKSHHFNVFEVSTLDGLFKMLSAGRIKYIPRGINEIYDEIESRQETLNNLVVEPSLALYVKAPYYIFVSPQYPNLAKRIELGLERMVKDGSHKAIFNKYYLEKIKKAAIKDKKVIVIDTPDLPPNTPLDRKELWFEYDVH